MPEIRKKYDREFREGAVRIVEETGKPIAQVARDLGVNEGTLGNWVARAREARDGTEGLSTGDLEELKRLRAENAELRMERDVLKRSVGGRVAGLGEDGRGLDAPPGPGRPGDPPAVRADPAGQDRTQVPRPAQAGLHRSRAEPAVGR